MASFNESIDVQAPISKTYSLFSDFEGFPSFMEGVEEVKRTSDDGLYWRAEIAGREEAWRARVTEQSKDARISWASVSGATNAGTVTFDKLDDDTTRVHMYVEYEPQGFMENVGAALGVVNGRIRGDLQRFKELLESQHDEEIHGYEEQSSWRDGETRWHDPVEGGRPVDYDPDPRRAQDRPGFHPAPGGTIPGGVIPDDRVAVGAIPGDTVPGIPIDDDTVWLVDESTASDPVGNEGRELRTETGLMADPDDTPTTSESRRLGEGEDPASDAYDVPLSREDLRLDAGDLLPPMLDDDDFVDDSRINESTPAQRRPPRVEGEPPDEG